MANKRDNVKINYLSRDFKRIKSDLIDYAKRYYPDSFRDFSDAGFGALMLDSVAYIGDMLSFYLDYQANESFLATATEYQNILNHAKSLGYKHQGARSTYGTVSLYVLVPTTSNATGPDTSYMPVLKAGSAFSSIGTSLYTLLEDVNFADSSNEIVVANTNASTGAPTQYAVKTIGQVVSGEGRTKLFKNIGNFIKFRRLTIPGNNVTEIMSVFDAEGNEYFEVDHLSQNIIFTSIVNDDITTNIQAPTIIKPIIVPRRFMVQRNRLSTDLIFGYGSDSELSQPSAAEPRDVVLDLHSKNYVTDATMDPSILVQNDKFGIAPANTNITVNYRANTGNNSNATSNSITTVTFANFEFANRVGLSSNTMRAVQNSLEVTNEFPIQGDISAPGIGELRQLIAGSYAAQNRAVTVEDYKMLALTMPPRFGGIFRCAVIQDVDSNLRNINLYIVNRDSAGFLQTTNALLKENLKTWLNSKRMINDSIDILSAKIVNLGIRYSLIASNDANKTQVLNDVTAKISDYLADSPDIGEPFSIYDIYSVINSVPGVVDALDVKVFRKSGLGYSSTNFNVKNSISPDGRLLHAPKNVIFEIKYHSADIQGTIK